MEAKDSPYYMGNHECLPTEFTIKTTEHVVKQELPWDANMEELCQARILNPSNENSVEKQVEGKRPSLLVKLMT